MPSLRTRRKPPAQQPRVNALVAAATLVRRSQLTAALAGRSATSGEAWQDTAWHHYQTCGELRFACNWLGNSLSRARLYAATQPDPESEPVPLPATHPASVALAALAGGPKGQAAMLQRLGTHLTVPGESFLVGWDDEESRQQEWATLCSDEIEEAPGGKTVITRLGEKFELPEDALIIRIWRPHPRKHWEADSPTRGLETILTELEKLTQHVMAQAESRLAGAGLLCLPLETVFPPAATPPQPAGDDDEPVPAHPHEQLGVFITTLTDAMVKPIEDRDDANAIVPIVIQAKGEEIEHIKHISFATPLSAEALQLREEAIKRLATGLDLPAEVLTGMGESNHWCVDTETEILTRANGWVKHQDLRVGDEIRTLDHVNGLAEWQPVRDIYRAQVTDEPMRELESRTHSSLTTLSHRWPTTRPRNRDHRTHNAREWTLTSELSYAHSLQLAAPAADLPDTPKYDDALVELAGWFWTEGSVMTSGAVTIAQSHTVNPGRVARIRAAFTALYGPAHTGQMRNLGRPAWIEMVQPNHSSHGGPVTVFRCNQEASAPLLQVAPGKRVSREFVYALTRAQLELFIDVSAQGDGHHYRSGHLDIWQRDPQALDAYELALVLAGYGVSRMPGHDGGTAVRALRATTTRPVKAAEQSRRTGTVGATDRVVPYTGTLWCPVTGNGTWLARRHGRVYFTGNSAWQIDEAGVRIHIEPVLTMICEALTAGYLLPVLGEDAGPGDAPLIWYDAAELKQRPDRSGVAADLYDRGELSGEALRREAGFGEPDAPDDGERRGRMLREMVDRAAVDGQLAVNLLVLLGYLQDGDVPEAPAQGELPAGDDAEDPDGDEQRALPERPADDDPDDAPPPPAAAAAANQWLAARLLARHVMTTAGRGLLAAAGRAHRGQHSDVPKWELHTRLPYDDEAARRAVDHALEPFSGECPTGLLAGVKRACLRALVARVPLTDDRLHAVLGIQPPPPAPARPGFAPAFVGPEP